MEFNQIIESLKSIRTIIVPIIRPISKFYQWIKKPQIVYGHFDSSSLKVNNKFVPYSHFYILMTSRFPMFFQPDFSKTTITIKLTPQVGQPSDFEVTVTDFLTTIGCEHLQDAPITIKNLDKCKTITFDMPAYRMLRINVVGHIGTVGHSLLSSFDIEIYSEKKIVNVKYKAQKIPYSKYATQDIHFIKRLDKI